MKVNFYDSFKDFDGLPLQINGEMQIVGRIVAQCLFNGTGIRPSGNQQTDADKKLGSGFRAYPGVLFTSCKTDRGIGLWQK